MKHSIGSYPRVRVQDGGRQVVSQAGSVLLVTTGRRKILRLTRHWPWTGEITTALERLALLATPG